MTTPPRPEQIELHRNRIGGGTKTSALKPLLTLDVSSKKWALQIR
jgi:hypothetical protein